MHVRDKIGNWNIGVQEWLRKCIYERSPFQSKVLKQLYVFMISAFWHGFYLGYYFSFLLWFLQVYFQGLVFKYSQRPDTLMARMYLRLGPARSWILALLATSFFTHNATFFLILEGSLCARFLLKIYCIPQLVFIALIIIFFLLLKNNPRNKLQ